MQRGRDMQRENGEVERTPRLSGIARIALAIGVLFAGYLLLQLGDGFPPSAWRLLSQALSGGQTGIPFSRLLLQSLVMLAAWLLLALLALQAIRPGRRVLTQDQRGNAQPGLSSSSPFQRASSRSPSPPWASEESDMQEGPYWGYPSYEAPQRAAPPQTPWMREEDENLSGQQFWARQSAERDAVSSSARLHAAPTEYQPSLPQTGFESKADTRFPQFPEADLSRVARTSSQRGAMLASAGSRGRLPLILSLLMLSSRGESTPTRFDVGAESDSFWLADSLQDQPLPDIVLHGAAFSSPGPLRQSEAEEDFLLVASGVRSAHLPVTTYGMLIVADGVKDQNQSTSRLSVAAMSEYLFDALSKPTPLDPEGARELLTRGMQYANSVLYKRNQQQNAGSIATMASILVLGTTAYVANIGDNRAYVYRPKEGLVQITFDHLSRAKEIEQGTISPADLYKEPKEAQVYRALGQQPSVPIDTFLVQLEADDTLLLLTDGIWKFVHNTTLQHLIEQARQISFLDPVLLATTSLQAALEAGSSDHLSAITAQVRRSRTL
jgi:serine/threonine protein phosphatase PrpC